LLPGKTPSGISLTLGACFTIPSPAGRRGCRCAMYGFPAGLKHDTRAEIARETKVPERKLLAAAAEGQKRLDGNGSRRASERKCRNAPRGSRSTFRPYHHRQLPSTRRGRARGQAAE
jgi:hypothetical protein